MPITGTAATGLAGPPTSAPIPAPAAVKVAPAAAPALTPQPKSLPRASRQAARESGILPRTSNTGAAWLLAFTPWLITANIAGAGYLAVEHPRWFLVAPAVFAVGIIGTLILGDLDRRAQSKLGWERSATPLLLLLGWFAYLVGRQVSLGRQGARVTPLLGLMVLNVVATTAAMAAFVMLYGPLATHVITTVRTTFQTLL